MRNLPCPAGKTFPHLDHPTSCFGRAGHAGPHWSVDGLRWDNNLPRLSGYTKGCDE